MVTEQAQVGGQSLQEGFQQEQFSVTQFHGSIMKTIPGFPDIFILFYIPHKKFPLLLFHGFAGNNLWQDSGEYLVHVSWVYCPVGVSLILSLTAPGSSSDLWVRAIEAVRIPDTILWLDAVQVCVQLQEFDRTIGPDFLDESSVEFSRRFWVVCAWIWRPFWVS
jgi:hypothetical protein